jgi:hypothetical protein
MFALTGIEHGYRGTWRAPDEARMLASGMPYRVTEAEAVVPGSQ